jgi:MFS family permease
MDGPPPNTAPEFTRAGVAGTAETSPGALARISRAFRHRNYRLFFAGQIVSLCGTFLSQVAVAWLVYRLTKAAWLLGVVGFAGQIPMFLLAPFAGVWVDRWDRRRLLVVTQSLSMLQSFGLAATAYAAHAAHAPPLNVIIGTVIALALLQGLINAFDMPGRQAFLVQMVEDREDLANAIALNSTMVHGARLVGPAAAGFLIAAVGETWCFALDGLSYAGVIFALLAMRVRHVARAASNVGIRAELAEGARYVWGFKPIRALLLLMAVLSLAGLPALTVLMPLFADALGGPGRGPQTLGLLMACSGLGALAGALYLASRPTVVGLGRIMVAAGALFGASVIAFGLSRHLWLSLAIVPFAGLGMLMNFASANTILQTLADDDKRGRVMSFFTMAFIGMAPFGNLIAGALASRLGLKDDGTVDGITGASRTLLISGLVCVIAAAVFSRMLPALRVLVRPVYARKGIIPQEVAAGLETAAEVSSPS